MNPFLLGFCISFGVLLAILLILRLTLPYAAKIFGPVSIPDKAISESTEWLNFVLYRVLTHFQSEEALAKINEIVSAKISPNNFRLLSLGNTPVISYVATLTMKEADDIRIIIPFTWKVGPSLDVFLKNEIVGIELDLNSFSGKMLLSWPGNSQNKLLLQFIEDIELEFELTLQLFTMIRISVTGIPLIGSIIKGFITMFLLHEKFEINLPKPEVENREE